MPYFTCHSLHFEFSYFYFIGVFSCQAVVVSFCLLCFPSLFEYLWVPPVSRLLSLIFVFNATFKRDQWSCIMESCIEKAWHSSGIRMRSRQKIACTAPGFLWGMSVSYSWVLFFVLTWQLSRIRRDSIIWIKSDYRKTTSPCVTPCLTSCDKLPIQHFLVKALKQKSPMGFVII